MTSLSSRLLLAASLVLLVFLGVTGVVLDNAFRRSAEEAVSDRLKGYVYAILDPFSIDEKTGKMTLPTNLRNQRFLRPESGLYARIIDESGHVIWRSRSMVDLDIPFIGTVSSGETVFGRLDGTSELFFGIALETIWDVPGSKTHHIIVQVTESGTAYVDQVNSFRRQLWGWLLGMAFLLLIAQWAILHWGLLPMRRASDAVGRIENGEAEFIEGRYPREIGLLTESVNSYIRSERTQLDRYRNTLGDLAHSLKTPLAVLKGLSNDGAIDRKGVQELHVQIDRMTQIVEYQLQKASTVGKRLMGKKVQVRELVERVVDTLGKVHEKKRISCEVNIDDEILFRGDVGDLMELVGNLLENAYKWADSRIVVRAEEHAGETSRCLSLCIDDDGPGIPENRIEKIMGRGVRVDGSVSGHGIGLAIVREIVEAYHGKILVSRSDMGGASFCMRFPY
jgi:two-component system sensor histidine kinase PhoQ